MKNIVKFATLVGLLAGASSSDVLQIPYSGGKQAQSIVITLNHGSDIAPDSIWIGNALLIRPYFEMLPHTGCTNYGETGLQFIVSETVRGRVVPDTNWHAYPVFPAAWSSMRDLDSVPYLYQGQVDSGTPWWGRASPAPGYVFAYMGYASCERDDYLLADSSFGQVVFVQGQGIYAKLKILDYRDTTIGPPPAPAHRRLLSITLRYVISDNPNDLSDPVSLRPVRRPRGEARFRAGVEQDLYNPLGIRLRRKAGLHEPALPDNRLLAPAPAAQP